MYKIIFFCIAFCFISNYSLSAFSLENTTWKATVQGQSIYMLFHSDTLFVKGNPDDTYIVISTYLLSNDTLQITDLPGSGRCDHSIIGVYRYSIKGNYLDIILVNDPCENRAYSLSFLLWVAVSTSVVDNYNINTDLNVLPNPVIDKLTIQSKFEYFNIEIFSVQGLKVLEAANQSEVDVSNLNSGIYYLVLKYQNYNLVKRFIKIR